MWQGMPFYVQKKKMLYFYVTLTETNETLKQTVFRPFLEDLFKIQIHSFDQLLQSINLAHQEIEDKTFSLSSTLIIFHFILTSSFSMTGEKLFTS